MITDDYGEIINDKNNYDDIAQLLFVGSPVIIGWTDELGSHYDILFNYKATHPALSNRMWHNQIQGGIRPATDLFVSIMRVGCFAFEVGNMYLAPNYYVAKLGLNCGSNTTDKIAELIDGVKRSLKKLEDNK